MPTVLNQLDVQYGGTGAQNLTDARSNLGIGGWGFNAVRNGCGLVAQRGTSFASVTNGQYTLDGWKWVTAGTSAAATVSQDTTEVPDENDDGFVYRIPSSIKVDVTTADATVGAGDIAGIYQNIEGYLGSALKEGATLSFWVRSPKTGPHAVTMINHGLDYTLGLTYEVNAADTWEYKTVTVPAHTILGTWNYTTETAIVLVFSLMCGETYWGTKDTWASGEFYGLAESVNQNVMDNTSNNFYLTDVKLTPGNYSNVEPPRDFASDLRLCQRYLWRWSPPSSIYLGWSGVCTTATKAYFVGKFPVIMRTAPTFTASSNTGFDIYTGSVVRTTTGFPIASFDTNGGVIGVDCNTGLTVGQAAILYTNTTSQWLQWAAEL